MISHELHQKLKSFARAASKHPDARVRDAGADLRAGLRVPTSPDALRHRIESLEALAHPAVAGTPVPKAS